MIQQKDAWSKGSLQGQNLTLTIGERTLLMGILNVTPDSFSDGGDFIAIEAAVERAKQMVADGADILDIGGESTRPGAVEVDLAEELRRVIPVIKAIRAVMQTPISVDTYKAEVARQALEAGADIINDIWGLQNDPKMAEVIVRYRCPVILMHNRKQAIYTDFLSEVVEDMKIIIQQALAAGIDDSQIVIDPGFGFAKNYEQNLLLMNHLNSLVKLGYPVLLGTSRKSMISKTLQLPAHDLIEGTAVTVALGIAQGCHIIRVHDCKEMKRVALMTDAIVRRI